MTERERLAKLVTLCVEIAIASAGSTHVQSNEHKMPSA